MSEIQQLSHYVISNPIILHGEPVIIGTRTPVRAIVENWRLGMRPEEMPFHFPHLTLAQVFAALSYYADHQPEINKYIEQNYVHDDLIHPILREAGL